RLWWSFGSTPIRTSAMAAARMRLANQTELQVCKIVSGVISPLLANIDLHYVLDEWFETEVKPRMRGHCFLVRFADDFVIGFQYENDARRAMEVLPKGKTGTHEINRLTMCSSRSRFRYRSTGSFEHCVIPATAIMPRPASDRAVSAGVAGGVAVAAARARTWHCL
ncbi:MAG: hypothetical protein AADX98_22555, partial [Thiocapsa sp. C3-3m]